MIGIIARCDDRGLGIQSKAFFDHIPCKALVIDPSELSWNKHPQHYHWYQGQKFLRINKAKRIPDQLKLWLLDGISTLFTFETPYDYSIYDLCRRRKVRSILQLNYELFEHSKSKPDLHAAPSMWNWINIPEKKIFLPVPVDTDKLKPAPILERTFVHIVGREAVHDRNGTQTFLNCLKYVRNSIHVIVRSQFEIDIPQGIPYHIHFTKEIGNKLNYWENYTGGVLVMPRKYGGLCLPCNEALAAEMPVIMPNISPNDWLPGEWLVDAKYHSSFMAKRKIDIFETDQICLAQKIDQFCDKQFYHMAIQKARVLKNEISWDALLPKYMEVLNGSCSQ